MSLDKIQNIPYGKNIIEMNSISLSFGGVKALTEVSFEVKRGEVFAIIGPNGAGKSSMLNVINGFYKPTSGIINFAGEERTQMEPEFAAKSGIARTFQNIALFKGMSTLDNIMTGRLLKQKKNLFMQALYFGPAEKEESFHREQVEKVIDFLDLQSIRRTPVGSLPYGLQKRVELGRALAMEPEILLLDEPMAGMNVEEKQDMSRFVLTANHELKTTIVLIEHDMSVVMDISDRIVVLDYGKKIGSGNPNEIRNNKAVIDAYLGVSDE